jgi:MscS family membrane protein
MVFINMIDDIFNLNFLDSTFYGNSILMWAYAAMIIIYFIIIGKIVFWIFKNVLRNLTKKTKTKLDDIIIDKIEEPIFYGIIIFGFYVALNLLTFSQKLGSFLSHSISFIFTINIAWLFSRTFDSLFKEYIVPLAQKTKTDFDDQILPILNKSIKTAIWVVGIIIGLNNAGYDVSALLAGLGIGGLIIGLAFQDTLKNIFGGITILTDKPFKVNDRVKIDGTDGFITEVGIRSTRVKTLEGRMITIPNSKFLDGVIENISSEPSRKIVLDLGLIYETTPKQIEKAVDILNKIAKNNENLEENVIISFSDFNDSSLNIKFIYYIKKGSDILKTKNDINMEILNLFNKNNLEFAFPSQTIYMSK